MLVAAAPPIQQLNAPCRLLTSRSSQPFATSSRVPSGYLFTQARLFDVYPLSGSRVVTKPHATHFQSLGL
jgi:hypothetical protein